MSLLSKALRYASGAPLAVALAFLSFSGGASADKLSRDAPVVAASGPPAAADTARTASYAEREKQQGSAALGSFRGGDEVLIIGPSVVGLVIVVVLLVVLL